MKQIRKPDKPKKENWFTRSASSDPATQPEMSQRTTRIITCVIIVALVIYVLYSMFGGKDNDDADKKANNTDVTTESNANTDAQQAALSSKEQQTQDDAHDRNIYNRTPEAKMPLDDGYDVTVTGREILKSPSGTNAVMVWVPTGYVAKTNARSVTLKPDGMDESITGNEPLSVQWSNMPYPDELRANGYANALTGTLKNDYVQYDYTVVDEYQYLSSDTQTSGVYVVRQVMKSKSDPSDVKEYWMVWIDAQASNRAYPILSIPPDNMGNILNDRYPDVPSLARAIFVPKEGEPAWNPDDAATTVDPGTKTPEGTQN